MVTRHTGDIPDPITAIQRRRPDGALDPAFGDAGEAQVPAAAALAVDAGGGVLYAANRGGEGCRRGLGSIRRLGPGGGEDESFGAPGCGAVLPFYVKRIAVQPDGGIVAAGSRGKQLGHAWVVAADPMAARLTAGGVLDGSFGDGGVVPIDSGSDSGLVGPAAMALGGEGSVLLAGNHSVIRLTGSGTLDEAYGGDGSAVLDGAITGIAARSDGSALVVSRLGGDCCGKPSDVAVTDLLPDGRRDPGFGESGVATLDLGTVDAPAGVATLAGGGALLAGDSSGPDGCEPSRCRYRPLLARLGASGSLDGSFGDGGVVAIEDPSWLEPARYPLASGLVPAPSGGAVVVGGGSGSGDFAFLASRLSDGAPDSGFGDGGSVVERRPIPGNAEARAMSIGPGGEIAVLGRSSAGVGAVRPVAFDFTRAGDVDSGLDPEGMRPLDWSVPFAAVGGHRLLEIVSGGGRRFVTRQNADGTVDSRYGRAGRAPLPADFVAESLIAAPGGSAIVVGGFRHGMAAYRLTPKGRPARRFGHHGLVAVRVNRRRPSSAAETALLLPHGRIALIGRSGVVRLLPGGRVARGGRLRHICPRWNAPIEAARRPGGVVVACGSGGSRAGAGILLVGLDRAWGHDRRFGRRGVVRPGGLGRLVSLLAARRRVVLVESRPGRAGGVVLRGYRRTGSLDRGYGRRGRTDAAVGQSRVFRPLGAAVQPGGRVVVAGTAGAWISGNRVELLRLR